MDPHPPPLSIALASWKASDSPKDLEHLVAIFGDRGLLILILILLFPAALPLPTGGFTHFFEIVALVPILQLVSGKPRTLHPRRIRGITLSHQFLDRFLPRIISVIKWFEGHSRPRLYRLLATQAAQSIIGIILLLFLAGAFLAPPFSGLDTLPAMGATVMILGLLLRDGNSSSLGGV